MINSFMRPKELIAVLVVFFGLLVMFLFFVHHLFKAVVDVKIDSNVRSTFQLLWTDNTTRFYNENNSQKIRIRKGANQLSIPIGSLNSIDKLRIDPLNRKGRISIKYFRISQPGFKEILLEKKEHFRRFIKKNAALRTAYKDDNIVITAAGNDPQLELEIAPEFNSLRFTIDIIRLVLSANVFIPALILTIVLVLPFKLAFIVRRRFLSALGSRENHQGLVERNKDTTATIFTLTFLCIVFYRFVFIATYPLNISGDGILYYRMFHHWQSSLVLAGGYSFVFGAVKQFFELATFFQFNELILTYFLLYAQHAVDLGVMVLVYLVLARIFGSTVAVISALLYGLNPFILGSISTTRPEWFQSCLFQLSLALAYVGYSLQHPKRKMAMYIGAGLFFTLGFFVKFNLLPFAAVLLLILFMDSSRFRFKLIVLTCALICSFAFYLFYVYAFHKPSTGTRALTHDKSWVLMYYASIISSDPKLNIENGINTKRFKVLTWLLNKERRPKFAPMHLYRHINAIPERYRKPHRDKYGYLLSANHEVLDAIIDKNPQIKSYLGNQMLISYFLGLKESDDLGTRVFLETVIAEPIRYVKKITRGFWESFLQKKENNVPLNRELGWQDKEPPQAFHPDKQLKDKIPLGYSEISLERSRRIAYKKPLFWMPGVHLFSLVSFMIYSWWLQGLWLCSFLVTAACIYARVRNHKWVEPTFTPVLLMSIMLAMIVWSNAIAAFRESKELVFILPYMCTFGGLAFGFAIKYIRKRRFR